LSCEKNSLKLGRVAGVIAGISALTGRFGNAVGLMATRAIQAADTVSNTVGQPIAPISNQVLTTVDRPATILANLTPALVATAASTQMRLYTTGPSYGARPGVAVAVGLRDFGEIARNLQAVKKTMKIVQTISAGSAVGGSLTAILAKKEEEQRTLTQTKRSFFWGEHQTEVEFTGSKLTGWLNRQDLLVSPGKIVSSEGEVIHAPKSLVAWHRGTTVVKMPQGEGTLTHLRTLNLPSSSYYFDRILSDAEVADIVTGQGKPHQMTGYVGQISAMENLAPGWAQTKRAMILTRLHWPSGNQSKWALKEEEGLTLDEIVAARKTNKPRTATISDEVEPLSGISVSNQPAGHSETQSPDPLVIKQIPKPGYAGQVAPILKNTFD
jgi:hypothetical protein